MVLLGLGLVLLLGFGAFALTGVLLRSGQGTGPEPTIPSPAPSSEPPSTPVEPTPQPSPTAPGDGYDPPPLPRPGSDAEATRGVQANALYDQSTAQTDCAIARLSDPNPPDLATMDAHLNRSMECLMQVWLGPMTAAGFELPQPPVRSYDRPITSACGTGPAMEFAAAFYCPADQRIFYAVNRDYLLFQNTSLEIDTTLAHEFGHALQGRTGMLSAELWFTHAAADEVVLEYSRRIELQANCFGGVAINALATATGLTGSERDALKLDAYYRGDREGNPRTHGNPDSARRWLADGLDTLHAGACNTFVAPLDDVA